MECNNVSNTKIHFQLLYIKGRLNFHLIGDSAYPTQPWMIIPYLDLVEGTPEARYNNHSIERVNGLLKSRFRCLLKHRTLNYDPIKAEKLIYSYTVLHNICRYFNDVPLLDDEEIIAVPQQAYVCNLIMNNFFKLILL